MAPWGDAKLFLCILFTCYFTMTLTQIPLDCCLSVTNKTIEKKLIADYHPQSKGCSVDATIFVTRRGFKLCAPVREAWVENVKRHVDGLKKFCKKVKYQGLRCSGVKPE
ncbi:C-C motif chemokine 19a.1 [Melanotaenia boesemani]|uniref:C-C motif chemokine 19a.1 n=1 Tax=Melanotaenia boesemani TaxID=1250792 RepID=UPI001C053525|nr:C-C motif chemokine 19a.1 [Melanotaenia boesemani]